MRNSDYYKPKGCLINWIRFDRNTTQQWGTMRNTCWKNNGRWNGKYHNTDNMEWAYERHKRQRAYKITMHTWATLERWNLGEICEWRERLKFLQINLYPIHLTSFVHWKGVRMRIKMRKRVVDRSSGWLCRYWWCWQANQ